MSVKLLSVNDRQHSSKILPNVDCTMSIPGNIFATCSYLQYNQTKSCAREFTQLIYNWTKNRSIKWRTETFWNCGALNRTNNGQAMKTWSPQCEQYHETHRLKQSTTLRPRMQQSSKSWSLVWWPNRSANSTNYKTEKYIQPLKKQLTQPKPWAWAD